MEERKEFIINVLYYALIFGLVYLFCNYLLGIFAPFLLGFLFAYFAVRVAKRIFKKESKINRIFALIFLYLIILAVISLLIILGISELSEFIGTIPNLFKTYVEPVLQNLGNGIELNVNLPLNVQTDINDIYTNIIDSIKSLISTLSSSIVSSGTSFISSTTGIIVSILTMVITSFFVVADYEKIIWYFESLLSDKAKKIYENIKDYMFNTVFSVVKCYGIIMFITFLELLIGLGILRVDNYALVAMITAFLDILPVLGVGTVLLPWGIFELIVSNYFLAIGLIVLYTIITIIRNILEPKFVGATLNMHPLATLFTMLVGLQLFGVIGMFGLPLASSYLFKEHNNKQNRVK